MRFLSLLGISLLTLSLTACFSSETPEPETEDQPIAENSDREEETKNVTYRGVLENADISIYMEGTHRLLLDDGRFLMLESDIMSLGAYNDELVEVTGDVRSTVEEGGLIMRVKNVTLLEISSSSSDESSSSDSSSSDSSIGSSSSALSSSSKQSSTATVASSAHSSSSAPSLQVDSAFEARINRMSKATTDADTWTQKYCTAHIGFCIPVHKNWWFKSFGATTTSLWHVELSADEILNLEDGPIVLTLQSGTVKEDGSIETQGDFVIGHKGWVDNRHFEVRASAKLRPAVLYILQNFTTYSEE